MCLTYCIKHETYIKIVFWWCICTKYVHFCLIFVTRSREMSHLSAISKLDLMIWCSCPWQLQWSPGSHRHTLTTVNQKYRTELIFVERDPIFTRGNQNAWRKPTNVGMEVKKQIHTGRRPSVQAFNQPTLPQE